MSSSQEIREAVLALSANFATVMNTTVAAYCLTYHGDLDHQQEKAIDKFGGKTMHDFMVMTMKDREGAGPAYDAFGWLEQIPFGVNYFKIAFEYYAKTV